MQYEVLMRALNCSDVACLIGVPAEVLAKTFTKLYPEDQPPCKDNCPIATAVDKSIFKNDVGRMSERGRRVPTMQGWCKHDGAEFIVMDIAMPQGIYTMNKADYH